jgi:hypothetical protein
LPIRYQDRARSQQLIECLCAQRPRVQKTLLQVAAAAEQKVSLLRGLDTFGHHLQAKLAAKGDDRPGESSVAAAASGVGDERPVDLVLLFGPDHARPCPASMRHAPLPQFRGAEFES